MERKGGIGLGTLFIILKLVGAIDWSWVWVLSPFWIVGILAIIAIAFSESQR